MFLQQSLHTLLTTEIRFCIEQNVEQHMWKITYYNLIETLRKSMADDVENKESYKSALLSIIDDVRSFFKNFFFKFDNCRCLLLKFYFAGIEIF